jgi:hypothetical protein
MLAEGGDCLAERSGLGPRALCSWRPKTSRPSTSWKWMADIQVRVGSAAQVTADSVRIRRNCWRNPVPSTRKCGRWSPRDEEVQGTRWQRTPACSSQRRRDARDSPARRQDLRTRYASADEAGARAAPRTSQRPADAGLSRTVSEGTRTPDRLDHNRLRRSPDGAPLASPRALRSLRCCELRSE